MSHRAPRGYVPTRVPLLSAVARTGIADLAGRVAAVTARGEAERDPRAGPRPDARRGCKPMARHKLLDSGHLGPSGSSLPRFGLLADTIGRARPRFAGALGARGLPGPAAAAKRDRTVRVRR
ncbi:hypothetical protein [Streptomyces sp. PalvLS-984]|uniref:hypothetical protein n=1 Tax=Streptomyces sp. PalvLS-984 TaxID=1839782 RepID=UPI000B84E990|nr:hypothetical protein [Streptomyces sp. PalvLS-984]